MRNEIAEMSYKELRETYKYIAGNYESAFNVWAYMPVIKLETVSYSRQTPRGKWTETARNKETVTIEFYFNVIESVHFFRSWGGSERVYKKYTVYGNVPFLVKSINPGATTKTIRQFDFV